MFISNKFDIKNIEKIPKNNDSKVNSIVNFVASASLTFCTMCRLKNDLPDLENVPGFKKLSHFNSRHSQHSYKIKSNWIAGPKAGAIGLENG